MPGEPQLQSLEALVWWKHPNHHKSFLPKMFSDAASDPTLKCNHHRLVLVFRANNQPMDTPGKKVTYQKNWLKSKYNKGAIIGTLHPKLLHFCHKQLLGTGCVCVCGVHSGVARLPSFSPKQQLFRTYPPERQMQFWFPNLTVWENFLFSLFLK